MKLRTRSFTARTAVVLAISLVLATLAPMAAQAATFTYTFTSFLLGSNVFPLMPEVNTTTNTVYVPQFSSNSVTVFDGATNSIKKTLTTGFGGPVGIGINEVTNTVYVANYQAAYVTVLDGATNTVLTSIPVSAIGSRRVAVNETTNKIYVTNDSTGDVTVIDGSNNTVLTTFYAGTGLYSIAVNETTNFIYTARSVSQANGVVSAFNGSNQFIKNQTVGRSPNGIGVNEVTNTIYVANRDSNSVTVINGSTNTTSATVALPSGSYPVSVAVNSAANTVFVNRNSTNQVSVIDGVTNALQTSATVFPATPVWIALNTTTMKLYTTDQASQLVVAQIQESPTITTATLPNAAKTNAYSTTVVATGLPAPTFSVVKGTLPSGLALDATTGVISGRTSVSALFTIRATNTSAATSEKEFTINVSEVRPEAPTSVSATSGNTQATLSWTAPVGNGGSAITGYKISSTTSGFTAVSTGSTATSATLTGLTNGTSYSFKVQAVNGLGTSNASTASDAVIPSTVPGVPTAVLGTAGNTQASVSWTAPTGNGGSVVTGYTVTSSPGGFTASTTGALSATVTGLTNGTSYTFTVTATNLRGTSSSSSASDGVIPRTVTGAPTSVLAGTPGNGSATVSWTAPTDTGGSAITGYTISSTTAGFTPVTVGAVLSVDLTGLTNGTAYTFTVQAINAVGTSVASSASSSVTPLPVPGAPTSVLAGTPGDGSATVSWTAPTNTGGSAITGYTISSAQGGFVAVTVGVVNTVNLTGLTNGTAYSFTVQAINAEGSSVASSASSSVTPRTVTGVPTSVSATSGSTQATLSWTAPTDNGGSAITGYKISSTTSGFTEVLTGSTATSATLTGLTNGTSYSFTVQALNAAGLSSASLGSTAVIPSTVPGVATAVLATSGNTQASVSWTAPTDTGGSTVTGYTVTSSPGSFTASSSGAGTTATVTGLTNGTSYTFTVTATNIRGTSVASLSSSAVTPSTVSDAPKDVLATSGNTQAAVSWTAPTDTGGSAVTGYTVTSSPGGLTASSSGAGTTATVTGLTNGTSYTFTVTATNVRGISVASVASSAVIPATMSDAPTSVLATAGNAQASVSWTAPVNNGGSAITGYTISSTTSGFTPVTVGAVTSTTLTGLINGTNYAYTVTAITAVGVSVSSVASATVMPKGAPVAPTGAVAVPGDSQVTVSWVAPASNGGSAITGYEVTSSPGSFTASTSGGLSATVTGLTNGTYYTFTVTATNVLGTSVVSNPSSAIPAGSPTAPRAVVADATDAEATVSWTAPVSDSGSAITGYTVTSSPGGFTRTTTTALNVGFTGLTNGVEYTFMVVAANIMGPSVGTTSAAVIPSTVSDAPTDVLATAGNAHVSVSWTAPVSNGGSAVTGYTVTSTPGSFTGSSTGAGTSATVTGLTNGTSYTFTVTATNVRGISVASVASSAVVAATVSDAPTDVLVTAGNAQASVSWTAPTDMGGSAVTGYTVTSSPGGFTASTSGALSATVTGLTNGTSYTFTVTAANIIGSSVGATSAAVIPSTVSDAPTSVLVTAGNAQVSVSWTAPTDTGGSAVTGYTVTSSPGGFTASTTSAVSATVTGLTNGTSFTFTVTATNVRGISVASVASSAVVPASVSNAPTSVLVTAGDAQASVSWTAPVSNGGSAITGYTIASTTSGFTSVVVGAVTSTTLTGLTNGTNYAFTMTATNAVGVSVSSVASATVMPKGAPVAPAGTVAVPGDSQATVSWVAPVSNGGSAITGYEVTSTPGSFTASTTGALSATVTGLTNGTYYTFTVTATNVLGTSVASVASSTVIPSTVSDAPTSVLVTAGNAQVSVSWTAPVSNGGSAVTGYTVTSTPGGFTRTTTTALTVGFTGLTNGVEYTFMVTAANIMGASVGAISAAVIPFGVPMPPTGVGSAPGNAQATVAWTAPVDTGGSPITGYTVTSSPGGFSATTSGLTSVVVAGLTNGVSYTFTVNARNAQGLSLASLASLAIVPVGTSPVPAPRPFVLPSATQTPTASSTAQAKLAIWLDFSVGQNVSGATFVVTGTGLKPNTAYEVVMRSTPVTLLSGIVGPSGSVREVVQMPADAPAGSHSLTLIGTSADGAPAQAMAWFSLDAAGTFVDISLTGPLPASSGADGESGNAAGQSPLPIFAGGALLLLLLAGVTIWALVARRRKSDAQHAHSTTQ